MKRLLAAALLLPAACATASPGGGDVPGGGSAPATRPAGVEVAVVPVDTTARAAVLGGDVAVVSYVDIPQAPLGCHLIARLLVEAGTLSRARQAVAEEAGGLGATLLVVANRNEVRTETSASRTGVGIPIVSNRYTMDAYDCR